MSDIPVKVGIRARPPLPKEMEEQLECCVEVIPDKAQVVVAAEKGFTFDYAFNNTASQNELYATCVKDLVSKVISGYNCSVMVYGQTGSGKTYTMGTEYGHQSIAEQDCGILPRVLDDIFRCVQNAENGEWTVQVSFLEIYNECAYDLLTTKNREPLVIRDTGKVVLPGLELVTVESIDSALACLERGCRTRSTGATLLNSTSSRSHAIFTVHLQCLAEGTMLTSKLQLVDLAGSETVKKTHSIGDRRKEGVNINLGLLALGNVINSLRSDNGKTPYISYRGSTLTRLLKDTLNGQNFTVMIACISPALSNVVETVNTLRFADRARQIKTKPVINRSNKENAYHRALENIPPTPAFWRHSGQQQAFKTPLHPTMNKPNAECHLQSTLLEPTEEDCTIHSFPHRSPITPSSATPHTTLAQQTIPITPLIERMCSRLEKTMLKDVVSRLEKFAALSRDQTVMEATPNDVKLTPHQMTVLDAIKSAKRNFSEQTVVQDSLASPILATARTPRAKKPMDDVTNLPVSAVAHRTRRRTTMFVRRVERDDSPEPLPAKRGRKSVACFGCRPATSKPVIQPVSAEQAQRNHNKDVLALLNSGSEKKLCALSCVGVKTAKILCLHTSLRGKLDTFEALKTVPGLGAAFYKRFMAANVVTV
ncbi:chromosome-associated kinesin KIF4-like isoform X2 [Ornithodoros turicata]